MDPAVVERARGGDREAFATLVGQVSDSLYAVAFRILRETGAAEDALQNALIATWQQLPHLRDAARFEAWSQRILVHACYAEFRRRRQFASNVHLIQASGSTDGSRVLADRDEMDQAFRHIPVDQRAVFVLHHYVGLPLVEIAETLGIPAGTARSRLHSATHSLRSLMAASALRTLEEGQPA
ncbi:MAG: polymerase sigma-70 factor, subfamily [Chloroflexota bacterium]|jgi:RNA polymerase sigma-70 factor (ECF subfamily)|nr:polymerase sigma-70 factor, subfamily [Chloroflexota bacterium]